MKRPLRPYTHRVLRGTVEPFVYGGDLDRKERSLGRQ